MVEKISEKLTRREKVSKLKLKILSEINTISNCTKEEIQIFLNKTNRSDLEYWNMLITREFNLQKLKEYIEKESTFMKYIDIYKEKDIIVYVISDKNLNVWLQEDYNFSINFLDLVGNGVFTLNDNFFEYKLSNIFDTKMFEKKSSGCNSGSIAK